MGVSLLIWAAVMVAALLAVRRQKASLGLTLAYLTGLLLIHVPGGLVHFLNPGLLSTTPEVAEGLRLSAIAALCVLVGLILFQRRNPQARRCLSAPARAFDSLAPNPRFWRFCLVSGLVFAFLASPLLAIPSIGAVVATGSAIWMLGALLAYRWFTKQQQEQLPGWFGASLIYPVLTLFLGGFLSYGTSGLINALSVLLVTGRRFWRVLLAYGLTLVFALSVFTAYFQNRNAIRDAVWGGASLEQRLDSASGMIRDFHIFDPYADADITATDQRLNQNYFAGLAALRIQTGQSNLLQGRTVGDALIALIPRALWPDKPVAAGSSDLVAVATGLILSTTTSFGVGNVMEAYINFGLLGVLLFFILFGYGLAWLDFTAFMAERAGNIRLLLSAFLPAIALIQPNGSFVELTAGALSAWLAGRFWFWVWQRRQRRVQRQLA